MSDFPSGTALLGAFERASQARRLATGDDRKLLTSRTSTRCFEGETCTKRWCCPLTAIGRVLLKRDLLNLSGLPNDPATHLACVYFPLCAAMIRWEAMRELREIRVEVRMRAMALELAYRAALLWQNDSPDFGFPAERVAPLKFLWSKLPGDLTHERVAERIDVSSRTISRWFSGTRPELDHIASLADLFQEEGIIPDAWALYRALYWHYTFDDLTVELQRLGFDSARMMIDVAVTLATCLENNATDPETAKARPAASFVPPPLLSLAHHADRHGASWRTDIEALADAMLAAGIPEEPNKHLAWIYGRMPKAKSNGGTSI